MSRSAELHRERLLLADGRELLYYNEAPDAHRAAYADKRELPPRAPAGQMRYDALRDEFVAVAAARQTRPLLPSVADCPLCPSTADSQSEIPAPDYDVVVFENRFPSFGGRGSGPVVVEGAAPLTLRRTATGRCEVVCFTEDHRASFTSLSPRRVRLVLDALADRTAELSADPDVAQVFCFENRGEEIGVTLHHPHGQIYGYPYVTPTSTRILDSARRHRDDTGSSLFGDVLAAERRAETRVVAGNEHWTAFVPMAARWPFEVHVYPHVQVPDLPALSGAARDAFAPLYLDLLARFDALFGAPMPYISGWHQAPTRSDRELAWLRLELFSIRRAAGKLKYLAGSESAMGAFVNDIPPETAAEMLREAR